MSPATAFLSALDRHRRRRRLVRALEGARRGGRWGIAAALALLLAWAAGLLPDPGNPLATLAIYVGVLAAATALGAAVPWLGARNRGETARILDGVLGPGDLAATAAAVAVRPAAPGRFGEVLLERAAAEVVALPVERAGPLPRPPWRLLGVAALVAVLLALLPKGGIGILPGLGGGWGRGGLETGAATAESGRREPSENPGGPRPGEPAPAEPGEEPAPDPAPEPREEPGEEPPPAEPPAVESVEVLPLARSYPSVGPVTVAVAARGGAGAGEGTDLGIAFAVDGGEARPSGASLEVAAGREAARALDLRGVGGLGGALGPGTHRVVAELRAPSGEVLGRSAPAEVVIEGPPGEGGGKGKEPDPPPVPEEAPGAPPPPPEPEPSPSAAGPGDPPPSEAVPDPGPSEFERKFVRPLFGEGPEAVKRGPILVLDPHGSRGDPPREMAPEEVLAEVRARAEAAARREAVAPRDREAVRRYFEALRRILEGGK